MKIAFKLTFAVLLVTLVTLGANAQLKIGPSINVPIAIGGDFGDNAQTPGQAYGLEIKYYLSKQLSVGAKWRQSRFALEVGDIVNPQDSTSFSGKNIDRAVFNEFLATVEYNYFSDFDENFFLYVGAEGGLANYTYGWEYSRAVDPFDHNGKTAITIQEEESKMYPSFGAYTGIALPVADMAELRAQLGYNMVMAEDESVSFVSVQFGVMFIIGKYWNED